MHIMNLQSSFTYDNFGRRTSRTLQMDNTTGSTAGRISSEIVAKLSIS